MHDALIKRGCGHSEGVNFSSSAKWRQNEELAEIKKRPCPTCGHVDEDEKSKENLGGAKPVYGSTEHQAAAPRLKTNRRAQRCERCGRMVKAGEGYLYYGGDEYESHEPGWRVYCKDSAACKKHIETKSIYDY